ncbi:MULTISPECIES: WhiB family transcriptional regulator [unclassified Microbacterium]|uniref:WhiB family transcriptional regulator n=1 Tax=unclassified Microbacterium TaxID=2609290 RepID=UPI000EA89431|nr:MULTISPECIES: WhiB family transcriptional regulator [unclassified Microbacterium]MBT2485633.1 WhiB family transcriptional regulator [Microbacterium sp. ISL-108]RKN68411.1 hypothetical protein D7252_13005 [Microbacterium sp. CGR2]
MSAATAWQALQIALTANTPSCNGDERFISETADHDAVLRKICDSCPVLVQCSEYGKAEHRHRVWGVYGGVIRRTKPQANPRRRTALPPERVTT